MTFDQNDWQTGEEGPQGWSSELQQQFVRVVFAAPQTQDGNTINVEGAFTDINGALMSGTNTGNPKRAVVVVSNSENGHNLDLATNATASGDAAPDQGTVPAKQYVVEGDDDGLFEVVVDNGGNPGTVWLYCIPWTPHSPDQYTLMSSDAVELTFT